MVEPQMNETSASNFGLPYPLVQISRHRAEDVFHNEDTGDDGSLASFPPGIYTLYVSSK
jgi:hypothetical protein